MSRPTSPSWFKSCPESHLSHSTQRPDFGRLGAFLAPKTRTDIGRWQLKPGRSERIEISN